MIKENDAERRKVNADVWHNAGYIGNDVKVVLLDSGGDARDNMEDWYHEPVEDYDEHGHSTNVGFVCREFAPGVQIYVMENNDEGHQWVLDHLDDIDLINVSMAGYSGSTVPSYVERYKELDIPLICGSGNDGYDAQVSYPAAYDFTIAIGALHLGNGGAGAYYANQGEALDAVTYSNIYVQRDDGHTFGVTGTSFSAPMATGMLACWMQWRKENGLGRPTREETRQFVHENCRDIQDEGFDWETGHGLFCLPAEIPQIEEPQPEPKPEEDVKGEEDEEMEQTFKDVRKGFWAFQAIGYLEKHGYIGGYSDGTFRPNEGMERGQFAAVVYPMVKEIERLKEEVKTLRQQIN
ncbi:S8 family peptidase [Salibacterium qingdaonense]|uniref:S-layer homology domain-containing protein n=1 Tax=Salibacterium qingdaonense TaxID=266892 RepID=A0A1I4KQ65_9BACI|nr:S8 family serine peptidase [Salibacterium qingdaonense]SFL80905.1 S-layer homology domain-containing protein [Salibacterium qingdaonense]